MTALIGTTVVCSFCFVSISMRNDSITACSHMSMKVCHGGLACFRSGPVVTFVVLHVTSFCTYQLNSHLLLNRRASPRYTLAATSLIT